MGVDVDFGRQRGLLPPLLLVLVAASQAFCVTQGKLSPWKGGGFGMFSTVDSPPSRRLSVQLTDIDRKRYFIRVDGGTLPSFSSTWIQKTIGWPTLERLEDLAWAVLDTPISNAIRTGAATRPPGGPGDPNASPIEARVARDAETGALLTIMEVRVTVRRLTPDLSRGQVLVEDIGPAGVARRNR